MPLSGTIDTGVIANIATWDFHLKGVDGNHYIVSPSASIIISQAESLSIVKTLTQAQWRTDLSTLPGFDNTQVYTMQGAFPVQASNQFYVCGYSGNSLQAVLVQYTVTSSASITPTGGVILTTTSSNLFSPARSFGVNNFGSFTYAVMWSSNNIFVNGGFGLLQIPNSGTFTSTTLATYFTQFLAYAASPNGYFDSPSTRRYSSRAGIVPDGTNIGVISYLGLPELAGGVPGTNLTTPGSEYWVINPTTQVVVTNQVSLQGSFGQPWPVCGLNHAGVVSGNANDDYVAPIVNFANSGYEIIFGRGFSDQPLLFRFRRFFKSSATAPIRAIDVFELGISPGPGASLPMIFATRDGGNLLLSTTNQQIWYFGQAAVAAPTASVTRHKGFQALSRPQVPLPTARRNSPS